MNALSRTEATSEISRLNKTALSANPVRLYRINPESGELVVFVALEKAVEELVNPADRQLPDLVEYLRGRQLASPKQVYEDLTQDEGEESEALAGAEDRAEASQILVMRAADLT